MLGVASLALAVAGETALTCPPFASTGDHGWLRR